MKPTEPLLFTQQERCHGKLTSLSCEGGWRFNFFLIALEILRFLCLWALAYSLVLMVEG